MPKTELAVRIDEIALNLYGRSVNLSHEFDDELLSAYLDDELTPEERARVEERLAADPARSAIARRVAHRVAGDERVAARQRWEPICARACCAGPSGRCSSPASVLQHAGRTDEARWNFPIGRSKRAWFWAATALAAGLLLMVFQQAPDKNRDLPNLVAQGERGDAQKTVALRRNEPLPALEMRAVEPTRDDVAQVVESPPTEPAAQPAAAPPASDAPQSFAVARGRELDVGIREEAAAPGGRGGLGSYGVRSNPQVALQATGADLTADELLVVHVNMKREAMRNRSFDALLSKNQIEVEQPAVDKLKRSSEPQDVDVVVVEAAPAQIYSCLADLKKDDANYVGIAVDDRLATSQRARAEQQPEAELTQYNRGTVPNQQFPQLAPDNDFYYFGTDRGQVTIDRKLDRLSDVPVQQSAGAELGFSVQGRATHVESMASSQENSTSDQGRASAAASGEAKDLSALAAKPSDAATREKELLSDEVQQNVARRAMQKLVTKADTAASALRAHLPHGVEPVGGGANFRSTIGRGIEGR